MVAASLVFPPPSLIRSLLPTAATVTRHTRSVILGEEDTGATGVRLPVHHTELLEGINVQASVCGLLLLRSLLCFIFLAEWDMLRVLPPPPQVLSIVPRETELSCEPHWEFGCVGAVRAG